MTNTSCSAGLGRLPSLVHLLILGAVAAPVLFPVLSAHAADSSESNHSKPEPLLIAALDQKLDGKEVTIQFTVVKVDGISQRHIPGQAPSFAIDTEPDGQKRLSVWVVGELTNILHQLQMGFLQDHELKPGTVIQGTGKLRVHSNDPDLFHLDIAKWENFKILPRPTPHEKAK